MKRIVLLCVLVVGLTVPGAALADDSVMSGYGGVASTPVVKVEKASPVVAVKGGSSPAGQPKATSGTLPFTGTDIMWFVLAGGALLVVGVGLRTVGRERG